MHLQHFCNRSCLIWVSWSRLNPRFLAENGVSLRVTNNQSVGRIAVLAASSRLTLATEKESEIQLGSVIAATYVPAERRVILMWSRNKNGNDIAHEVRHAFKSIHLIGWTRRIRLPAARLHRRISSGTIEWFIRRPVFLSKEGRPSFLRFARRTPLASRRSS